MSWAPEEVVFALDCEMVTVLKDGKQKQAAGHVVLVKSDKKYGTVKVLDTYIRMRNSDVRSCKTQYSQIERWMLKEGIPVSTAVYIITHMVKGHTLVTFGGKADLDALGITEAYMLQFVSRYIDLQRFFKRENGQPYGLGPLVEYFDYKENGEKVIINHDCEQDAKYTLRLYLDHWYDPGWVLFLPEVYIRSAKEYKQQYGLP